MNKKIIYSLLFSLLCNVTLMAQDTLKPSKQEFSIYSSLSVPFGAYRQTDVFTPNVVGRALPGLLIDGSYSYYFNNSIGANLTLGYNYNALNIAAIEDSIRFNYPFLNPKITNYTNWEMIYLMPGINIQTHGKNRLKLSLNAGVLQLLEAGNLRGFTYNITQNFAAKGNVSIQRNINSKLKLEIRGGVLYSEISRTGVYNRNYYPISTTVNYYQTFNLITLNAGLGLTWKL
jgi:hypothetical protein